MSRRRRPRRGRPPVDAARGHRERRVPAMPSMRTAGRRRPRRGSRWKAWRRVRRRAPPRTRRPRRPAGCRCNRIPHPRQRCPPRSARRLDDTCDLVAGDDGRRAGRAVVVEPRSAQSSSPGLMPLACTRTRTSPGPGAGPAHPRRPVATGRAGHRRAVRACQRTELNAARTSEAKSCGSSQAAKCPPLSTSLK